MCRVLEVSRSGYYAWESRPRSQRDIENEGVLAKIKQIHKGSRGTYGSPRVQAALELEGVIVGINRIARLMQENGIKVSVKRSFTKTTLSNHDRPIAKNLLERNFTTDAPNQVWVTDITYLQTSEGWLYLSAIIDLFSRRVIGWAMEDNLRTEGPLKALHMALANRSPADGLIHHSDRGSQYASHVYRAVLSDHDILCSMSRKGDCWDNAVAESFFGTLKTELAHRMTWRTRAEAKTAVFEYIEVFYNRQRLHSSNGNRSPVEFESVG